MNASTFGSHGQGIWAPITQVATLKVGALDVWSKPFTPHAEAGSQGLPPDCKVLFRVFMGSASQPFSHLNVGVFSVLWCTELTQLVSEFLLKGIGLYVAVYLVLQGKRDIQKPPMSPSGWCPVNNFFNSPNKAHIGNFILYITNGYPPPPHSFSVLSLGQYLRADPCGQQYTGISFCRLLVGFGQCMEVIEQAERAMSGHFDLLPLLPAGAGLH